MSQTHTQVPQGILGRRQIPHSDQPTFGLLVPARPRGKMWPSSKSLSIPVWSDSLYGNLTQLSGGQGRHEGGNAQKVAKSDPNPDGMLEGPVGSVAKLRYG